VKLDTGQFAEALKLAQFELIWVLPLSTKGLVVHSHFLGDVCLRHIVAYFLQTADALFPIKKRNQLEIIGLCFRRRQ
jgi:hypothetical protein